MFLLVKWYCDLVTDQGRCLIVYAARLQWGALRFGYAATLFLADRAPAQEKATFQSVSLPQIEDDALSWRNDRLGIQGTWVRKAPPIERCLAQGQDGVIEWNCHMPRARGTVRIGDASLEGLGYVECLRLTIPPGRLPFHRLHWGRHISDQHCLVWIQWANGKQERWAWLDGREEPGAVVHDSGVSSLVESRRLVLEEGRELRNRPVHTALGRPFALLARVVGGSVARMQEHKRLAPSSLVQEGQALDRGWTIHEEVVW